ncbi:fusaric acid resistance protein family protein 2 [Achromobacter xylosoxidans A8]|uniref:Fusaric acid resistance protein family protein 2 n=1 Tax=Achromobacter xylosoxidans (strain A8) TaxID=762376 RepID=E3HIF5_ACHXA|nr:FUSC family protein [Achromobacter xylosoxidans]ADP19148.1 fusaric acid resistance protein family protein 2 [Achromobacter xylosoxidans A8]
MARPAADSNALSLAALRRLLTPFPGRGEMTLRMTVICVLTALVASAYGTPEAALSVYVVFFLLRPDRVTSAVLSTALLVLVTLVIGLILLVTQASIDYPVLRVSAMTLLSIGLLYLTSASKLRPVGAILAMIVGFGLDMMGSVPIGEVSTRILLYAWLMVAIPVSLAIVVSVVLAPSPRRLACGRLARRLRQGAQRLTESGPGDSEFDGVLHEGNKQILTWLKLSVVEGSSSRADAAALRQAAVSSIAILGAIDVLCDETGPGLPPALAHPLARTLDEMADMLEQGGYPVDVELDLPSATALSLAARAAYDELCQAIAGYAVPVPDAIPTAPTQRGGFFLPDAGSNPEHIAYALKTTGAAMFCYLLYTLLDWPGIHTCFITCYIVSLGTSGETVQKLRLRLIGCLIGAATGTAALVFLVPHMDSVGSLLALVGAASAVSAWIAVGPPRIAYAGFQIAFAFFLCVIQGPGPGFDLTIARDRTIGILLGNIVVYLVFTRIWPVSIGTRVDQALAALREQWHAVATSGDQRHALAAEALAAGREAAQNLALAVHEPSWVRPDDQWRDSRRDALARLSAIAAPLTLAAGRAPGDPALMARLNRAGSPGVYAPAPSPARRTDTTLSALLLLIDARAARAAPVPPARPAKESTAHAPA